MSDGNGASPAVSEETKKFMDQWKSGMFAELQGAIKTENEATIKNIEGLIEKAQDEISKHQTALEVEKKAAEERDERIKDLELQIAKGGGSGTPGEPTRNGPEYKAFMSWIKAEDEAIDVKSLRTDVNTQGGYLLPEVIDGEIRKNITEISPVRLYARVRPAASKSVKVTRRGKLPNNGAGAPFEGELEEGETGQSTYIEETVTLFRQSWTVPVTRDMLLMAAHDVESEIMNDVYEEFALGENKNFLNGTGHKGPKGIITDTRVQVIDSATTNLISWTDLCEITGELKRGQKPMFFFNRKTFAELAKLSDNQDRPIWMPIAAGGALPPTLAGYPYSSEMIDLDDYTGTAAGEKPIIFGDLRRGYEIFDLAGVHVIRDDYTGKKKAQIEYTFDRYLTGQVILPEAIKVLRTKV